MDPISLTAAGISFTGVVAFTSSNINRLIQKCRDANADLTAIQDELTEVRQALLVLEENDRRQVYQSPAIREMILRRVKGCAKATDALEVLLKKYGNRSGAAWALTGRERADRIHQTLKRHKDLLSFALQLAILSTTNNVREGLHRARSSRSPEDTRLLAWLNELSASRPTAELANTSLSLDLRDAVISAVPKDNTIDIRVVPMLGARQTRHLSVELPVHFITLSNGLVAATTNDYHITIWDVETGKPLQSTPKISRRRSIDTRRSSDATFTAVYMYFLADTNYACLWNRTGSSIWTWRNQQRVLGLPGVDSHVISLVMQEKLVLFWPSERQLWKAEAPDWNHTEVMKFPSNIISLRGRGSHLAILLSNGNLLWMVAKTGLFESTTVVSWPEGLGGDLLHPYLSVADDESQIVAVMSDNEGSVHLRTWEFGTKCIRSYKYSGYPKGNGESVSTAWFVPGRLMAIFSGEWVDVVNVTDGTVSRLKVPFPTSAQPRLSISSDGKKTIATRTKEGRVQLWDLNFEVVEYLRERWELDGEPVVIKCEEPEPDVQEEKEAEEGEEEKEEKIWQNEEALKFRFSNHGGGPRDSARGPGQGIKFIYS